MEDSYMKNKQLVQNTIEEYLLELDAINREELEKVFYDELILGKSLYVINIYGKITRLDPSIDFIVRREAAEPLTDAKARERIEQLLKLCNYREE